MNEAELQSAVQQLIGKAMAAGECKYGWPYQRIEVYNGLVREALDLIRAWDNGREWHIGQPSSQFYVNVPIGAGSSCPNPNAADTGHNG